MSAGAQLVGRVALVVGATGTIGEAISRTLADEGAFVLAGYRVQGEKAHRLATEIGGRAVAADVTTPEGLHAVSAAIEECGDVGILVNGFHPSSIPAPAASLDIDDLDRHFGAVRTHQRLCALVIPGMRRLGWGRIVYLAGATTARPLPGMGAYASAKAAGAVLTRQFALEEGMAGITANVVSPGPVAALGAAPTTTDPDQRRVADNLLSRAALGRFATPEDVAHAVSAVVSPAASGITGQTLWVTGGESIA